MINISLRNTINAAVVGLSLVSISAHANYSFNFDGVDSGTSANDNAVNPYAGVSFQSAYLAADLDMNGFEILDRNTNEPIPGFTHWEAYTDSDIRVNNPLDFNHGVAPSGTNALNGLNEQIFIKFDTAQNLNSFSAQLDNSLYGIYNASYTFVDRAGKVLSSVDFDSVDNKGSIIASGPVFGVQGVILSSGKFYDNVNIINAAPVPEPETYAMLLVGLGLVGGFVRRRNS